MSAKEIQAKIAPAISDDDVPERSFAHKGRGRDTTLQQALSKLIDTKDREAFLRTITDREQLGHITGCSTSSSGAWLRAVPNKNLFMAMQPNEFRASILWRLFSFKASHRCALCNKTVDNPNGRHTLCCKHGGGINARHNAVRNELHNMALAAGHAAALEVGDGHGKRRPGDVVIKDNNPTTFVDIAVIHPLQPKYQKQAADRKKIHIRPVDAYAKNIKDAKYKDDLRDAGLLFVPFVADVHGNLSDEASATVTRLARARAIREGELPSKTERIARIKLSFVIASAVARMLAPSEHPTRGPLRAPGGLPYGPSTHRYATDAKEIDWKEEESATENIGG